MNFVICHWIMFEVQNLIFNYEKALFFSKPSSAFKNFKKMDASKVYQIILDIVSV